MPAPQNETSNAADVFGFRREVRQVEGAAHGAANHQRQLVDQLVVYGDADFRVFRGNRNGAGRRLDRLRGHAHRQFAVHAHAHRSVENDTGDTRRTEAFLLEFHGIGSDRQLRDRELAAGIGWQ